MMNYIIPGFIMLTLDGVYLSTIGGPLFNPMIKNIQGEKITLNPVGIIMVYVLMLFVLYRFIIMERKSPRDAFVLGGCIYGVFDFTNIAIFNKYKYFPALVDMFWGGTLFYLTTWATYQLGKIQIRG